MSFPPQGNKADVGTISTNVSTLLTRLSAARAGYLDNINQAGLLQLTTTRAGYLDELAAANIPADVDTLVTRLTAARAGYLDAINRDRPDMVFPSVASDAANAIVVMPAVAADLDFPSVVVADLPTGMTVARADFVLVIGALFDTSSAENQIDQASKSIRVKVSTGSWGTDDIIALTFANNALQTKADSYRGGPTLFGGIDISSVVSGNGTYNFRSEETNRSDALTVTGASLECLDVFSLIRVWFN